MHIFKSRIARRILLLFVLSALLPLVLFASVALFQVTNQLEQQAREDLHAACKSVGMSVVERLDHLHDDLALMLGDVSHDALLGYENASAETLERFDERFDWVALATDDGKLLNATRGDLELPTLDSEERAHLDENRVAILYRRVDRRLPTLMLCVALPGDKIARHLFGAVRAEYLWGGDELLKPNATLTVLTDAGERLFPLDEHPNFETALHEALQDNISSGFFEYHGEDTARLISYRTVFGAPRFLRNFVVVHDQQQASVVAPIQSFKLMFVLFALVTLGVVSLTSLSQIRRCLIPIVLLQEGTQRLADGSSDEAVEIESGDEFEDLAASFNSMAGSIRERTEQLERANRAKADFLAHMSHEIRTPLTAVLGYTELALSADTSETERLEQIQIIHSNGEHLLEVVNEILDMSSVEAGEVVVTKQRCDPVGIVADLVGLLEVRARKKQLELTLEQDSSLPRTIETDPTRLRKILLNVIRNAIEYTERGHVLVRTEWRRATARDGHELVVHVLDTGKGIPADELESIFEPFYQADNSMSRSRGGTGLGLSLSRKLARLLGGDITCKSELHKGSEFTITIDPGALEIAPSLIQEPEEAQRATSTQASADEESPRRTLRILLAEDVPVNRLMIAKLLIRAGLLVDEAENGRVALAKALRASEGGEPYDVVLMDMQMPEMDGYTAARCLREAGYAGPIVALTAHSLEGDRERCLGAGCDDYATKPIDRVALLDLIHTHATRESMA